MKKYIQDFWTCLISVGADKNVSAEEAKYVRHTNVVAVLTTIAVASYIPHSLLTGNYALSILQAIDVLCILSVLGLNHIGYNKASRHVYLWVVNSFVLINACFVGHESRIHEFFYITYIVPFLLFNVRDYKHIVGSVLSSVILFYVYEAIYPLFTSYNLDMATQLGMVQINTLMKFILLGIGIYILAYYNYKTEVELAQTNEKLNAQAIELKRSNEDLEQFGYIISHDLKAPVRNISSFMSLLLKQFGDTGPKGSKELLEMSKQSSDRLSKQIEDMLSYCRVDRNLPPSAPVDLNHMVRTIQMELNEKIKEKNAEITVVKPLPVLNEIHSSMLHHVFQNLIANGLKFNNSEKPEVRIDYTLDNGVFTFTVADNGIGIDAIYKSKLFQMFKRLHSVDQYEGTGIGLAVCKKIITFYNGDIWFEGEPGKGTTFYFTLAKPEAKPAPQIKVADANSSIVLKAA